MCRRLAVLRVTVWVGLQMDTGRGAKPCWRVLCGQQLSRKAWFTLKRKCCLPCKRSCPFFLGRRVNAPWAARASIREWGVDIFHFHQWVQEFSQGARNLLKSSGTPPSIWLWDGWNVIIASWTRVVLSNGPETPSSCQHWFAQHMSWSTNILDIGKKKKKTTSRLRLEERQRSKENWDAVLNFYLVTPLFLKMPFAEHLDFRAPLQYIIYLWSILFVIFLIFQIPISVLQLWSKNKRTELFVVLVLRYCDSCRVL